jgi:hypothetical protein
MDHEWSKILHKLIIKASTIKDLECLVSGTKGLELKAETVFVIIP